ncbi:hypothetical protein GWI33_002412 [Rhynchophorus ferrugineus]|uniref:Uncharacterized protein n=1 Tax=Rhynchophorus ferrugineus TaxID=354439 RepID=A0A834ITX2_RHYFE|nr:hypothetical protein GWI33_002412 [Rhynchophorus ferrugineus]
MIAKPCIRPGAESMTARARREMLDLQDCFASTLIHRAGSDSRHQPPRIVAQEDVVGEIDRSIRLVSTARQVVVFSFDKNRDGGG